MAKLIKRPDINNPLETILIPKNILRNICVLRQKMYKDEIVDLKVKRNIGKESELEFDIIFELIVRKGHDIYRFNLGCFSYDLTKQFMDNVVSCLGQINIVFENFKTDTSIFSLGD